MTCVFFVQIGVGCLQFISHPNITLLIRNHGDQGKTWLDQLLTSEPNYVLIIKQVVLQVEEIMKYTFQETFEAKTQV